jgi:hypothetical protein
MATAQLNALSRDDIIQAVTQILDNSKFWEVNPHIPIAARAQTIHDIKAGAWKDVPIFSLFAATYDKYSQIMSNLSPI